MLSVGVRELKEQTSQILRRVREQREAIEITHRGRAVARLIPVGETRPAPQDSTVWADLDELAAEIGRRWPDGISAADAVREGRRDF